MNSAFPRTRCLPLLLGAMLAAGPLAGIAADWQALTGNSPFGQSAAPTTTAAPDELEFRGVVQEEGVYLINLFNPTTKTSQWIPVKGRAPGLEVRSYDAGADKVEVTQGGRQLTLALKQARVALVQAATPPPEGPAPNPAGNPDMARGRPANGNENSPMVRNLPPEAQAMIQEFRRRRAERSSQSGPNLPSPEQRPQRQQRQP